MPPLPSLPPKLSCRECRDGAGLGFDFSMAFQPIVDIEQQTVYAYEALVRGPNGEGALHVLGKVNDQNRYQFDQAARVKAIMIAAQLQIDKPVSINFFPNAVYRPETCIRVTLEAAREVGFPTSQIIFEVNEAEPIGDRDHLMGIFTEYRKQGFKTAIDDFGAGYAGLALLADFMPDVIKIDMALVRDLHQDKTRRAIIAGIVQTCRSLEITVVAEGVEIDEERDALRDLGIVLQQGYRFARPSFASVVQPVF